MEEEEDSILYTRMAEAFGPPAREAIEQLLAEAEINDAQRSHLHNDLYARLRDTRQVLDALRCEEDVEELYRCLAFLWLEFRLAWMRCNQVLNYTVVLTGEYDVELFVRGSLVSHFVSLIEPALRPDDFEHLVQISSEPLEVGRPDATEVRQRFEDLKARAEVAASLHATAAEPVAELHAARQHGEVDAFLESYEARLSAAEESLRQARSVKLSQLWTFLKSEVEAGVDPGDARFVLRFDVEEELVFDVDHVKPLSQALCETAKFFLEGVHAGHDTTVAGPTAQMGYVTLRYRVDATSDFGLIIELRSDGPGSLSEAIGTRELAAGIYHEIVQKYSGVAYGKEDSGESWLRVHIPAEGIAHASTPTFVSV